MQSLLFSALCLKLFWILSCRGQSWPTDGVYYGMLGSNVTLACGTSPQRSPVEWRLNQSSTLPWHRVTANGSLVLFNVNQSAKGNYSCHGDQGTTHSIVSLMLGYPPGPLNVSCRVPNHKHVRCSWVSRVKTFLPAQYHAFYWENSSWKLCVVDSTNHHCDIAHPHFWQLNHRLNITEVNPLGAALTRQTIQLHKLLKPDPPAELVVTARSSFPTHLNVSWRYPHSWPQLDFFPLLFQIRYRPHGSTHWAQIESMGTNVVVHDALEGYLHEVQVRAQDEPNADSHWSDWSPLILARPWEAPGTEQPDVSGGTPPTEVYPDETETITSKNRDDAAGEEEKLSLVILLVIFSIVIFIIILSLTVVMCLRQRDQRDRHVTKQEVSSMLKMKAIPL
ncbi:interleukin-11 receptor subunit alpha isoform X1 [Gadus macrocephalus]|uniref:interleukin-11 receptor subunit alpha isoform X1 n=1 Tax=Gadus macrocephalus TaxID=80720 RepID=UPI0028CB8FD3|nr:interleukin-11 receptor subunit alpha isoform X1 [Gadus macrocephalus]XP_059894953.1 interleukin-11 receptor subunit alpha isoform X1 [Gadus macrocephalus]